jgi:predicted unusual protein kinase regulating ubiquinone biosynthesis (AarF/ABC1/UbiB family)
MLVVRLNLSCPDSCQDDVPCFPDEVAFEIMRNELGRPLEEVFSSISEKPIAAASLGQVRHDVHSM